MCDLGAKIKVLSANCQGLRNYQKRSDVLRYLKETCASTVCLQDTHLLEKEIDSVKKVWIECYIHGVKSNSCGVAVLINNNFEHEVIDHKVDKDGTCIQLLICWCTMKINLINIYAPNQEVKSLLHSLTFITLYRNLWRLQFSLRSI